MLTLCFKYNSQVTNVNDFWEWIDQTLVPGLYSGAWYNGNAGKPGFLNDKMSFVVGVARIRQLRVKSGMNSDSRLLNARLRSLSKGCIYVSLNAYNCLCFCAFNWKLEATLTFIARIIGF